MTFPLSRAQLMVATVVASMSATTVSVLAQPSRADEVVMVQLEDGHWEPRKVVFQESTMTELTREDGVIRVAPLRIYHQFVSTPPNDPDFDVQWHLTRNQASRSWQHADGSGVAVAVIDSGVTPVSDLACHEYVSPYDFVDLDTNPDDLTGHGTFVTQVIAECTDNAILGSGVAPGVSVMPIKVIDASGTADSFRVYQAMLWAKDHGADVINLSLGFGCLTDYDDPVNPCSDVVIDSAIDELSAAGILVVAAAGNDGSEFLAYPANHPDTLAVGASGFDRTVASYSSRGPGLHMVAPTGDDDDSADHQGVIHQGSSGGLHIANGTSFSAPQVTGAYALLRSTGASRAASIEALFVTASDITTAGYPESNSGWDRATGWGELRIRDSLTWGAVGATAPMGTATFHSVGDVDDDGQADSIVYDKLFGLWWVLNSTSTAFTGDRFESFATVSGWRAHLTGDFDGDGTDDIASFHPSNGTWWVSRSTGSEFVTTLWADYATASGWGSQLVGDFNNDGMDDIANYHSGNGTWWVSLSNGSHFKTTLWVDFVTSHGWQTHLVGDFSGDGKDEIASYHPSNGTWWMSLSDGSAFSTDLWADFATASGWSSQLVGDFNEDGLDDIANYYPGNGTWWVSLASGSGFDTDLWADFDTASGWSSHVVGDFNRDGRDDIGNYHPGNGTWWVSLSDGSDFNTGLWADFSTSTGWTSHLVGDFNGDGRDDIANSHSNGTWWVARSTGSQFSTGAWYD